MPKLDQTIARPGSLKDAAYRQIKDMLLSCGLEHDRLYSAQHFAEMLGVSRTPVREALLQLTSEDFLVCLDVRGFKIKEFTDQEIRDVFETRTVIETYLVERLADSIKPEDVRAMEQSIAAMTACAAKEDAVGFLEADKEFHMVPVRRSGNRHLLGIMESIRNHISLYGLQVLSHAGRYQEVIREHGAILAALRQGDRKTAVAAVGHHLATTRRYLVDGEPAA